MSEASTPSPTSEFGDKVVLVTGAARGLGAEICRGFTAAGATVVGVDLAGECTLHADVGSAQGVSRMVEETLRRHGRIDVLVLNAGVQHKSPIESFPEDRWDAVHDVLLKGPFLAMRSAWPALRASRGSVVVVSSTSAVAAEPHKTAYVSAKAGVSGLVRAAALDGAPDGIRVNAVAPGWMRTPMAEAQVHETAVREGISEEEALRRLLERQPISRFVELAEVTEAVLFLAGRRASAITGIFLPVDCGLLAA